MKKHKVILKFTKACYDYDYLSWHEVADTTFYNWVAEDETNFDVVIKICRLKNHLDFMKSKIIFIGPDARIVAHAWINKLGNKIQDIKMR